MAEPIEHPGSVSSEAPLGYQPLSLAAIVALPLAAVYGVVVLVGFAASILFGSPWLMPGWTLLFPLAAVALALVARSRIRRSEGTLAGTGLANWAITLSVLFSLIFISHWAATYVFLHQQAESFTRQWFDKLTGGDVDGAFTLTLRQENRPTAQGVALRNDLEHRFNAINEMNRKGPYSAFQQRDEVRHILQAGPHAEIKLLGIVNWDYLQGGYQVLQKYRVSTPTGSFELRVLVHDVKSTQREAKGHQWYVMSDGLQMGPVTPNERGANVFALQAQAQQFAADWQNSLRSGRFNQAVAATLPPAERQELDRAASRRIHSVFGSLTMRQGAGLVDALTFLARLAALRDLGLPGYTDFTGGNLVRIDEKNFWPNDAQRRAEALAEIRKLFQQPQALGPSMDVTQVRVLPWMTVGDRFQFRQDVQFTVGEKFADGALVLECDAKALDTGKPEGWRVASLELLRFRDVPRRPPGP